MDAASPVRIPWAPTVRLRSPSLRRVEGSFPSRGSACTGRPPDANSAGAYRLTSFNRGKEEGSTWKGEARASLHAVGQARCSQRIAPPRALSAVRCGGHPFDNGLLEDDTHYLSAAHGLFLETEVHGNPLKGTELLRLPI